MQSKELIVLTCASGNQCAHLIPLLYNEHKLRLVVNSENSAKKLKDQWPGADVVQADLQEPKDAQRILKGATAAFHLGPPFHARETEIGYNMVDAAVEETEQGNFKHLVFSSVIDTQLRKLLNHDVKRYIEEYLIEAGADGKLNYTILQPTHFMDMFPVKMFMQNEHPVFVPNWDPDVLFSFIALKDLGEAAANVLNQREKHYFAHYAIVSTPPISYTEFVKTVSKEIGKEIRIEQCSFEDRVARFFKLVGLGEDPHPRSRDAGERMLLYYNTRGLIGNPNILRFLLGREPTSHVEWARLQVQAAKESS